MFYEKGIDNLDAVIEEAGHTIENMEMLFTGSVYDLAKFDEQDFVDEYLSECYAEAYDEILDYTEELDYDLLNYIASNISMLGMYLSYLETQGIKYKENDI